MTFGDTVDLTRCDLAAGRVMIPIVRPKGFMLPTYILSDPFGIGIVRPMGFTSLIRHSIHNLNGRPMGPSWHSTC